MRDLRYLVSILLVLFVFATGIAGFIQTKLDLHHFIYHRYLAYGTLILSGLHVAFNFRRLYRYLATRR